ncbi:MAG TPA: ubiquitin-like small modifier protein 1 [Anaerolineaceae bacterium]|jgi:molybdopterin converting factor small subunit
MSTLRIPTPLRPYANGQSEITVQGQTVGEALSILTDRYTGLRPHLYTTDGQLRAFVNLFLNDEDIRQLQGLDTPIKETDRLILIPSIAGGLG